MSYNIGQIGNLMGLRVWKVHELDREQLLAALKITDQHLIIEGIGNHHPLVASPEALDSIIKENEE